MTYLSKMPPVCVPPFRIWLNFIILNIRSMVGKSVFQSFLSTLIKRSKKGKMLKNCPVSYFILRLELERIYFIPVHAQLEISAFNLEFKLWSESPELNCSIIPRALHFHKCFRDLCKRLSLFKNKLIIIYTVTDRITF